MSVDNVEHCPVGKSQTFADEPCKTKKWHQNGHGGTMKGTFMNPCVLSQYIKIETFLVQSHVSISSADIEG